MSLPQRELEQRIVSLVKANPQTHDVTSLYYHFEGAYPFAALLRTVKTLVNNGQGVLDYLGSGEDMKLIAVNPVTPSTPAPRQ